MKSHDFGQFIFNNAILDKNKITAIINLARTCKPTLAVEALFLQLLLAEELTQDDDDFVRSLITPRQAARAQEFKDGQSLAFAQGLINNKVFDYAQLEKVFDKYHSLEIPSIESALTNYYDRLKNYPDVDFPLAVDLIDSFHSFLSETLKATIIVLPPSNLTDTLRLGATVKMTGELSTVIGLFADEYVFMKLAKRYDSYVEEVEDAYDAIAELLNVYTGHFVVKAAVSHGMDEQPEPPKIGTVSTKFDHITLFSDIGTFYIYIGKQEIFN